MPVTYTFSPGALRAARRAAGIRMELASVTVGIAAHTVREHELGNTPPKATNLAAYASLYGVTPLDFYTIGTAAPEAVAA